MLYGWLSSQWTLVSVSFLLSFHGGEICFHFVSGRTPSPPPPRRQSSTSLERRIVPSTITLNAHYTRVSGKVIFAYWSQSGRAKCRRRHTPHHDFFSERLLQSKSLVWSTPLSKPMCFFELQSGTKKNHLYPRHGYISQSVYRNKQSGTSIISAMHITLLKSRSSNAWHRNGGTSLTPPWHQHSPVGVGWYLNTRREHDVAMGAASRFHKTVWTICSLQRTSRAATSCTTMPVEIMTSCAIVMGGVLETTAMQLWLLFGNATVFLFSTVP